MNTLFESPRFWGIIAIAVLQSAVVFHWITNDQVTALVQIIQVAIGGMVTVKTIDRAGDKKVEAAMIASRSSMPAVQMGGYGTTTGTCNQFAGLGKVTKSKKH